MLNILNFFFYSVTILIFLKYYKNISIKLKIIDRPNKKKIHKKPTPLIGGIIVFFIVIELFFFDYINYFRNSDIQILIIINSVCFIIGFFDDKINIKSYIKLFIIGLTTIFLLSFSDSLILHKLYFKQFNLLLNLNSYSIYFTTLCLLLLINAYNLSDGINGLAIIIAVHWIIAIFYFIFSININYLLVPLLTLFIIGIYIYRGKFFLGDSGSLLISSLIGSITIYLYNLNIKNNSIFIPAENFFLTFIIPGLDMLRLFVERLLKKKDHFLGDTKHLHHLLIAKYKLKKTLLIYTLILCFPFYANYFFKNNEIYIILFVIFTYFYIIHFLKKNYKS
jgi:UDP-GlcNAc:undecaprenyl-phosphate GlcNAc-1-phosphate transferase